MSCIIRLVSTVAGVATEFDAKYVKKYDPTYVRPEGYDGGILEVTADPKEALRFPDFEAAMTAYRQAFGTRADGQPNRPLTAWSIEIDSLLPDQPEPAVTSTIREGS